MSKREPRSHDVLRVPRSGDEARHTYDRMSGMYDRLVGAIERGPAESGLGLLEVKEGETVLEIGFGTGRSLERLARQVGKTGAAYGVDLSPRMAEITRKRLSKAGLETRAKLHTGNALALPYDANFYDAVFMCFVLELFDTPDMPRLLAEVKRVLKPGGRVCVVSLTLARGRGPLVRMYERAHRIWPKYVDCRPIYVERSLREADLEVRQTSVGRAGGLPVELVLAGKKVPEDPHVNAKEVLKAFVQWLGGEVKDGGGAPKKDSPFWVLPPDLANPKPDGDKKE